MSKFIDKLNKLTRVESSPIGFREDRLILQQESYNWFHSYQRVK